MNIEEFAQTPLGYEIKWWFGVDTLIKAYNNITDFSHVDEAVRITDLFDILTTPEGIAFWTKIDQVCFYMNNIILRGPNYKEAGKFYYQGIVFKKTSTFIYEPKFTIEMARQVNLKEFQVDYIYDDVMSDTISFVMFDHDTSDRYLWDGMTQNLYARMPVKSYDIGVFDYPNIQAYPNKLSFKDAYTFYLLVDKIKTDMEQRQYAGTMANYLDDIMNQNQLPFFIILDN